MTETNILQNYLINNHTGYFSDKLYRLQITADNKACFIVADKSFQPRVLILARPFYQESIKSYPVNDKAELKKILSLTAGSEFDTKQPVYWKIISDDGNTHQVNFWIPQQHILHQYKPLIWLPESLILACSITEETVFEIQSTDNNWFLFNKEAGCVSLVKGPIVRNVALFLSSVGIAADKPGTVIGSDELPDMVVKGLTRFKLADYLLFFKSRDFADEKFDIWPRVKWGAALLVAYFGLTSGYLLWQAASLEQQKTADSVDVEQALALKTKLQSLQQRLNNEKQLLESRQYSFYLWDTLSPLLETDMRLSQIFFSNGRFRITGRANKATEILKILSELDSVQEAKFESPVAKVRGSERFMISFILDSKSEPGINNG